MRLSEKAYAKYLGMNLLREILEQDEELNEIYGIVEQASCPGCGSRNHLHFHDYDHGRQQATGYQDQGERFKCTNCGTQGDADDTKVRPRKRIR